MHGEEQIGRRVLCANDLSAAMWGTRTWREGKLSEPDPRNLGSCPSVAIRQQGDLNVGVRDGSTQRHGLVADQRELRGFTTQLPLGNQAHSEGLKDTCAGMLTLHTGLTEARTIRTYLEGVGGPALTLTAGGVAAAFSHLTTTDGLRPERPYIIGDLAIPQGSRG